MTMANYKNIDSLVLKWQNTGDGKYDAGFEDGIDFVLDEIDKLPAEVVLCKNCKYSRLPSLATQIYGQPGTLTCKNPKAPCNKRNVNEMDFCSYGEQKTDEEGKA